MKLKRRLERLEEAVPPPSPHEVRRQQQWVQVVERFLGLAEQASPLLNPDDQLRVEQALAALVESGGFGGPYAAWLRDLEDGWSRLPALAPQAMKELLLAWLLPGVHGGVTCRQCGVEWPHRNYHPVLVACPGCSSPAWDWSHLVPSFDRAWKALDGYAGSPPVAGSRASGGGGRR
jgi:hypothetical protein